jgi:hypothetical protein
MATFKTRVESVIGTVSSTTLLDTWLSSGAKFVLVQIPSQKLLGHSQEISFTSFVSLWNRKFVGLSVGGYEPKLVSPGKATQAADSTSLHYATALTPAYLIKGDTVHVFPTSASGSLFAINYPDVVNTDTSVANFPPELEEGIVLYACITGLLQRSFDRLATDIALMTFGSVTAPTAISGTITMTLSLPTFVQPVPLFDTTNAGTYTRTDEDLEKGSAELQIQQVLLSKYNEDIQNANAVFQADIAKYTAELAKEKAETDLEVQQYIARVQLYAQQIGYEVNKFSSYATKTKIYLETNQALASTLQAQLTALIQGFING